MSGPRSLLEYLDAPVLVGDPDGRVVYVNPKFESRFGVTNADALGQSMATLFEGGAREAVLQAVASVCGRGGSRRFLLRDGGYGYHALASPISDEGDRVGVVILLSDEQAANDRVLLCSRELHGPVEEIEQCLRTFAEHPGGRVDRIVLDDALRAVERLRKRADELESLLNRSTEGTDRTR